MFTDLDESLFNRRRTIYLRLSSKMSKIGQVVPEIWAKKWSKSGQIEVPESFFLRKSREIYRNIYISRYTEKMMMNIIENFVADNIVFGTEVLAHHPEQLPLEIWKFTNLLTLVLEIGPLYFEEVCQNCWQFLRFNNSNKINKSLSC